MVGVKVDFVNDLMAGFCLAGRRRRSVKPVPNGKHQWFESTPCHQFQIAGIPEGPNGPGGEPGAFRRGRAAVGEPASRYVSVC